MHRGWAMVATKPAVMTSEGVMSMDLDPRNQNMSRF